VRGVGRRKVHRLRADHPNIPASAAAPARSPAPAASARSQREIFPPYTTSGVERVGRGVSVLLHSRGGQSREVIAPSGLREGTHAEPLSC